MYHIPGDGRYEQHVVGESHYQDALERVVGGRMTESAEHETTATLVCDDGNRFDRQAVRVDIDGRCVGHLSREDARAYRGWLAAIGRAGERVSCGAVVVGGWDRGGGDRGHFGVRLDTPLFAELVDDAPAQPRPAKRPTRRPSKRRPARKSSSGCLVLILVAVAMAACIALGR